MAESDAKEKSFFKSAVDSASSTILNATFPQLNNFIQAMNNRNNKMEGEEKLKENSDSKSDSSSLSTKIIEEGFNELNSTLQITNIILTSQLEQQTKGNQLLEKLVVSVKSGGFGGGGGGNNNSDASTWNQIKEYGKDALEILYFLKRIAPYARTIATIASGAELGPVGIAAGLGVAAIELTPKKTAEDIGMYSAGLVPDDAPEGKKSSISPSINKTVEKHQDDYNKKLADLNKTLDNINASIIAFKKVGEDTVALQTEKNDLQQKIKDLEEDKKKSTSPSASDIDKLKGAMLTPDSSRQSLQAATPATLPYLPNGQPDLSNPAWGRQQQGGTATGSQQQNDAANVMQRITGHSGSSVSSSGSSDHNKQLFLDAMNKAGLTDNQQRAAMAAVVEGESHFKMGGETSYAHTSNERIKSIFGSRVSGMSDSELTQLKANPEAFFNKVYGGRLGNAADEGYKYRGRGFNQLTGKGNYEKYGRLAGVDLVNNPDLLNDPAIAAKVAVAYMKDRTLHNQGSMYENVARGNGNAVASTESIKVGAYNQFMSSGEFATGKQANLGDSAIDGGGPGKESGDQVVNRLQKMKQAGLVTNEQCVSLAAASVGLKPGEWNVHNWDMSHSAKPGSLPIGTPVATHMDNNRNQSDRYAGGGSGTPGANKDHAAVITGYEYDKSGNVIGMKVAEQWAGSGGIRNHTYYYGKGGATEQNASMYNPIYGPDGKPLGPNNPLRKQLEEAAKKEQAKHEENKSGDLSDHGRHNAALLDSNKTYKNASASLENAAARHLKDKDQYADHGRHNAALLDHKKIDLLRADQDIVGLADIKANIKHKDVNLLRAENEIIPTSEVATGASLYNSSVKDAHDARKRPSQPPVKESFNNHGVNNAPLESKTHKKNEAGEVAPPDTVIKKLFSNYGQGGIGHQ